MAIVILGLGLGFVKSMFDKTTSQIKDINKDIERQMIADLKESTERILLDQDNLEIEQGKTREVYLGLRNELETDFTFDIDGTGKIDTLNNPGQWTVKNSVIACFSAFDSTAKISGDNSPTAKNSVSFTAIKKINIKKGEILINKIVINVAGKAPPGTYSCSVIIKDPTIGSTDEYARKDFMITVPE
jgi:hypothetical protein